MAISLGHKELIRFGDLDFKVKAVEKLKIQGEEMGEIFYFFKKTKQNKLLLVLNYSSRNCEPVVGFFMAISLGHKELIRFGDLDFKVKAVEKLKIQGEEMGEIFYFFKKTKQNKLLLVLNYSSLSYAVNIPC